MQRVSHSGCDPTCGGHHPHVKGSFQPDLLLDRAETSPGTFSGPLSAPSPYKNPGAACSPTSLGKCLW